MRQEVLGLNGETKVIYSPREDDTVMFNSSWEAFLENMENFSDDAIAIRCAILANNANQLRRIQDENGEWTKVLPIPKLEWETVWVVLASSKGICHCCGRLALEKDQPDYDP